VSTAISIPEWSLSSIFFSSEAFYGLCEQRQEYSAHARSFFDFLFQRHFLIPTFAVENKDRHCDNPDVFIFLRLWKMKHLPRHLGAPLALNGRVLVSRDVCRTIQHNRIPRKA